MNCQIPHDIHIRLKQAEIYSHRIIIIQFADVPFIYQFANLAHGTCINERVIDVKNETSCIRFGYQLLGLFRRFGYWLLDEDVLATTKGLKGEFEMRGHWRRDYHRIDARIRYQRPEVCGDFNGWIADFEQAESLLIEIRYRANLCFGDPGKVPHKIWSPVSVADNANIYHTSSLSRSALRLR